MSMQLRLKHHSYKVLGSIPHALAMAGMAYALSTAAAMAQLIPQPEAAPAATSTPQADPAASFVPPGAQPPVASGTATPTLPLASEPGRIKSLFYTPEEINEIHLAINSYIKYTSGREQEMTVDEIDFLNQLSTLIGGRATPEQQNIKYYTYPQFFLESLVYRSPADWVVWVSGRKIDQDTPKNLTDLRVTQIDADKVAFEWHPSMMSKVNEVWAKSPNEYVDVDKLLGIVSFTLRPNQTFSSYNMRIMEGKVLPVTMGNQQDESADVQTFTGTTGDMNALLNKLTGATESPAPVQDAYVAPEPAGDPEKQGLRGLIGAYQRLGHQP